MTGSPLQTLLDSNLDVVPGAVALVSRGGRVDVAASGHVDTALTAPMQRDTIFRIASATKPITAAAVLTLVDAGVLRLDDPISDWIPELARPMVLRTPTSELDDVVPAERQVTVRHILASTAGWGFTDDFETPVMQALFEIQLGLMPAKVPPVDEWLAALARIPLIDQPGRTWSYNTCSDLQGILVAHASGQSLPDYLRWRLFDPLGMTETAFEVGPDRRERLPTLYTHGESGALEVLDPPDGEFAAPPAFPSGAAGLTSTVDDLYRFAQLLLGEGSVGGREVLSRESVRLMTTDHLTAPQRDSARLFMEGQGWGFGGSVDVERIDPWNVPGRYGWVGGSGTASHVIPSTGAITILLTQVAVSDPAYPPIMRDFWGFAAG